MIRASHPGEVAILNGIAGIASSVDLILCDVWGVLHDGVHAHRGASDALTRFRALPGERPRRVVLVSNAPRPGSAVLAQLDSFGVPRTAYDTIVTSGDLTRRLLAERADAPMHHLGPDRDLPIFEGLDLARGGPNEAAHVVVTGLLDDEVETAADYRAVLEPWAARGVTLICANPDLVVERGERLIPCAGAIAALYEEMGGAVVYAGKPHVPVYEAALATAEALDGGAPLPRDRVLAIGDAIRTDVAGARAFGIASLLVARGIHAEELGVAAGAPLGDIAHWLESQAVHPDGVIDLLRW
ncbi:HAD-superfamily class IIA hydrolase, TIGR01459 [Methylobacterium sp. 174MFSha1.1]|uniref:TIGR01459 family HAD-type hydrolase n=1 Tax=Methylobacterium sp. 174MFSha1.1 TaxID=1502749 RepID=UPI0008EB6243|nr:TIGR01459 family HAD-type hydrolase [Methylobacterium sp. 174MFSha1.1]SFV04556.1 HAD-superfamily class IIA hydrolase, TIGR01459 [Methylobacterium sp. 174MFSha1.1]